MMWMMGSTLNLSSSAAREMDMVLKSEIASHAAYDPAAKHSYQGLPVPGRKQVCKVFGFFSDFFPLLKSVFAEIFILHNESGRTFEDFIAASNP